jgi:hypothetical protein
MGTDQRALRALFACVSGLSEPEIGLEHAFVLLIWQKKHDKWQNSHGARLQNFHWISSVSRPQRPLRSYSMTKFTCSKNRRRRNFARLYGSTKKIGQSDFSTWMPLVRDILL